MDRIIKANKITPTTFTVSLVPKMKNRLVSKDMQMYTSHNNSDNSVLRSFNGVSHLKKKKTIAKTCQSAKHGM